MKRQTLFNIHFYLSSFFSPFLLVMALTGTLYLFGEKGSVENTLILEKISFNNALSREKQIKVILKKINQDYSFESIKDRGRVLQTRPTSRKYYSFEKQENGTFHLYKLEPNFLRKVIEVHKGHGPKLLKSMQKALGICLVFIIITGLLMSLKINKRAKSFVISAGLGSIALILLFLS